MSVLSCACTTEPDDGPKLEVKNGWYVHEGRAVWGNAQHNGFWRSGRRPNLTKYNPNKIGPNRTEDLDKLTDNMLRYGYPGFEHTFGLFYDSRRGNHKTNWQKDDKVLYPVFEQPWSRSGQGRAWDGLSKYDLTKFNDRYFSRLKEFAVLCDRKGTILIYNFYLQTALLRRKAHYVDFPWRPRNCLQDTGMPRHIPAASTFYDVSHPTRRRLHKMYIEKVLEELGGYSNVIFLIGQQFTGPASFEKFWLDTIMEWQKKN